MYEYQCSIHNDVKAYLAIIPVDPAKIICNKLDEGAIMGCQLDLQFVGEIDQ